MSKEERHKQHLRHGLILSSHSESTNGYDIVNDLFFTSVMQMNLGGPEIVQDPEQKILVSRFNLKAGKLLIASSDYSTAFTFFQHGISYLGDDRWTTHYQLSLDLFTLVSEAACELNKNETVRFYSDEVIKNARTLDDSLQCESTSKLKLFSPSTMILYLSNFSLCHVPQYVKQNTGLATSAFSLRGPLLFKDAKDAMLHILSMLDEPSPREMGDLSLISDMNIMNEKLQQWSDDDIYDQIRAMQGLKSNDDTKKKRNIILISLYAKLAHIFHFVDQGLSASVSLRMLELTMSEGLSEENITE